MSIQSNLQGGACKSPEQLEALTKRFKVAYCLTHPIQYQSPLIRYLRGKGVDIHVVYGNDSTARVHYDEGFDRDVAWDVPLLEGYPNTVLNGNEPVGTEAKRQTLFGKKVANVLDGGAFDAVWIHGWAHAFTKAVWEEAQKRGIPLMLRGETFLGCVRGGWLRRQLHRLVLGRKFHEVAAFLAVGTLNRRLYRRYGVPEDRIFSVPYVVDNDFFRQRCQVASARREAFRTELGIETGRPVILFCAKLIAVKDPATLVHAMGRLIQPGTSAADAVPAEMPGAMSPRPPLLLMVGDGELRPELEKLAAKVAPGLVRFLGFRNQTELPALYDLCDVFVLPSVFEPWGLVVNEVMNAGKPVVVSDQVGCGPDLVKEGVNGSVFPKGDVDALSRTLQHWISSPVARDGAGKASLSRIAEWGFEECYQGVVQAMRGISGRPIAR